jgi:ribosome biogenesis protein YTM1
MIKLWSTSMNDLMEQEAAPVAEGKKRKVTKTSSTPIKHSVLTLDGHVGTVSSVVYNSEKKNLYSGGYDHSDRTWDLDSASNVSTMNCECVVLSVDYSPASQLLVSGHSDNFVRIWDPRAKDGLVVKMKFAGHSNWVSAVSWCPSSMFMFASASYDGSVRVWDMRSSSCMYSLKTPSSASVEETPKLLAMDWSGELLSTGGEDGELYNYSTST